jgi:hypothetical protein
VEEEYVDPASLLDNTWGKALPTAEQLKSDVGPPIFIHSLSDSVLRKKKFSLIIISFLASGIGAYFGVCEDRSQR